MKIFIPYDIPNWNEYINLERKNMYAANSLKQKEKGIVKVFTKDQKYNGKYPIEVIFRPHFKDYRKDLDNTRIKGLLDGLVACKVIENDNLRHIQRIVYEPVIDNTVGIEIEIKEL